MNKILVPVDFSLHTEASCRYALDVARTTGAELILFHSFFDQVYFTDGGFSTSFESGLMLTDEIILDFYKQKEALLKSIADDLEFRQGLSGQNKIRISCLMESGDPEVQIIRAIEIHQPDLIIMASAGMGKKGIFSGSVARRIIDHTDIPVLAVPAQTETRPIRNVAYMSAFESRDAEVIAYTEDLLARFEPNFFIVHLLTGKEESDPELKIAGLAQSLGTHQPNQQRSFHLIDDNENYEKLKQFLSENQIDLIVFIPHKRNVVKNLFYHGITRKDLFLTHIPLLAARPSGLV